eukprot:scaffold54230_cov28-Tisochrysis_lutea.AAC.5
MTLLKHCPLRDTVSAFSATALMPGTSHCRERPSAATNAQRDCSPPNRQIGTASPGTKAPETVTLRGVEIAPPAG